MYVREIDGQETTLGVSGSLWRGALVIYDRYTKTNWSQIDGRALMGKAVQPALVEYPSVVTTWKEWKHLHPDTLVLLPPKWGPRESRYTDYAFDTAMGFSGDANPDDRLPGKSVVLGIHNEEAATAVPMGRLVRASPLHVELAGEPFVVVSIGKADGAAFRRTVDGQRLDFEAGVDGSILDVQTGSLWDPQTGRAFSGPLTDSVLTRLETRRAYWFVWVRFHPDTQVLE